MDTRLLVPGLLATLLALPSAAGAESHTRNVVERTRDVVADLLVARPLGLIQVLVGVAVLPITAPHQYLTRTDSDWVDICVGQPVRHTFQRPLGEL